MKYKYKCNWYYSSQYVAEEQMTQSRPVFQWIQQKGRQRPS